MTIESESAQFTRALKSAIFLPVGAIFLAALFSLFLLLWLFEAVKWSDHSYQVTGQIQKCENNVLTVQDDARGYLLTGDHAFMDSFDKDSAQMNSDFAQLAKLVSDNPEQTTRLEEITQTKNTWYQHATSSVTQRSQGVVPPADWTKMGKSVMDELLSKIDRFSAVEGGLRLHRFQNVRRNKIAILACGALLTIVLSFGVARMVRRQFHALAEGYRAALKTLEQRHAALVRSEAELEEQKEWFRVTLSSIGDGVIVTDIAGRIVFMNGEAEHLTGWPSGEALLKPSLTVFKIINQETRAALEDPVATVFREKKVVALAGPCVLVSRQGDFWPIEDSAAPIYDADRKVRGVVLVFHNATEKRAVQNSLKAYSAELERMVSERTTTLQQTINELEAFSYTISHDLRSPLRAMQGFAQAVQEDYAEKLDERGQDYLRRIRNAAERLDRLIQDLLAYTRISRQEAPLVPLDLDSLVHDIIEHYPNLHPPAAIIEVKGKLPAVMGRESALTQVISNLLGNAVKFVSPGTTPRIEVRCEEQPDKVRLWVQDNGIGIAPGDSERIFEMFVRSSDSHLYGGTGIGLAIVKKAVQTMQGAVGLESEEGKGSKFWVDLAKVPTKV